MAATFRPVNSSVATETIPEDAMMPSASAAPRTPRPSTAPRRSSLHAHDDAATPTRASFGTAVRGQQPLPSNPFPPDIQAPDPAPDRSAKPPSRRDSMDVDADDSDAEPGQDDAASDDESVNADDSKSGKKKKSQRFYCTDFPPCSLSFTRSEHLARHIRYAPLYPLGLVSSR